MIDFFAALGQPRQPWLDPDPLRQKYHLITRTKHPDVRPGESATEFENANEAYRVLLDPKLRIQHLLALEGILPLAGSRSIPADFEELFLEIGALLQKSQRLLGQLRVVTGALTRSLLKSDLLQLRSQTSAMLEQLSRSQENCLRELQQLNQLWHENRPEAVVRLQRLQERIAYVSRWMAQVEEIQFQFSVHE